MAEKNPRLKRVLEKVRPKTFFEDLAEYGYLMQYIEEFMKDKWDNDNGFQIKILNILYEYAKYPTQELNHYYLWHFNHAMEIFSGEIQIEKTS